MMRLSDVNTNETVMISHIEGSGAFRARLSEMGFVTGKPSRNCLLLLWEILLFSN